MPLSATVLAEAMRAKMDALSDEDKADRDKTLKALAEAIVTHLKQPGLVSGSVTTGAGSGGVVVGALL